MTNRTPHGRACLHKLASERRLPAHQPMDRVTLGWIASNRPVNFDAAPSFPRPGPMLVPARSWFATPRLADSNHGIRHNARVSLLAALLAEEYGLDDDVAAVCAAGAVHDCRRRDDRADPGHGQRAAAWFQQHTATVTQTLGRRVSVAALHRAAEAIAVHGVPYDRFTMRQERAYRDTSHLVDVLKAADCLDRYRLPLQRWWPDTTRLRIPVPDWLPPAAFALVVRSEQAGSTAPPITTPSKPVKASPAASRRPSPVDTDLDDAHTDYTDSRTRPAPVGCAESEDDWRRRLQHDTPGGWLLAQNAMTRTLTSGGPIHLMHTTAALDAIRASGQLYASSGCLLAALYCSPLTPQPTGLRPHNLGAYLLQTKPHTRTLVIEITPTVPVPANGIDYLRLGRVHLQTYVQHRSFLTEAEDVRLRGKALQRIRATAPFLDVVLANATGRRTPSDTFVDQLAAAARNLPFLGYLYFEVLSEYLMLHSTSMETQTYAAVGEMNNRLYKRLAFYAVSGMDKLFDLSRFHPGHRRLHDLIAGIEPRLAPGAAQYTRDRLSHLFTALALEPGQDATAFTFHNQGFDSLTRTAPSLLGQTLFREMRILPRYPQLYLAFEQAKALRAWSYWNSHQIATPFNGFLPKGEIGVNPAYPADGSTVWLAETCERGLLHPIEELSVAFVPRMADLNMTAMRRDAAGKAAGHPVVA